MGLSTVVHSKKSPDNSPRSHSVLPVLFLPNWPFQLYISLCLPQPTKKWGWGCLMSAPCLESQDCHLIPLYYFLSVLSFFSACWPILLNCFQKSLNIFRYEMGFLYGSCLAARRRKLVGGMCSTLPYDTGICCYAFIPYFFIFYCFCPFLFLHS